MKENAIDLSVSQVAVEALRRIAASRRVTNVRIARELGCNRVTVAYRFANRSMDLDSYCRTARLVGVEPGKLINRATALVDGRNDMGEA